MKPLLTLFALLLGLAVPAFADEAAGPVSPSQQAAAAATTSATRQAPLIIPATLPHSTPPVRKPAMSLTGSDVPMPLGPPGGGCHHDDEQVYLTN